MNSILLNNRFWIIAIVQTAAVIVAFVFSLFVRFDFSVPNLYWNRGIELIPALIIIKLPIFWYFGMFKGWWRYVSMPDLIRIAKGNVLASAAFVAFAVFVYRLEGIPRSVLLLDLVFCFLLIGGARFITRAFRENFLPMAFGGHQEDRHVLVVGAGKAGQAIVREIRSNANLKMQVVGFVDDDPLKRRELFQGVKVLGEISDLESIIEKTGIDEIIIAIPSATGGRVRDIVNSCNRAEVEFKILPGVGDLINGSVLVQQLRPVDLEDLLGREEIRLDDDQIASYLQGKKVLVTGAGGSIGSELCRQISRFTPQRLILFESAETPLFHIESELKEDFPNIPLDTIIGDIRNRALVDGIFTAFTPEVVFHAAAYKHVPMMESNPAEAVSNNIQGSRIVAEAAHASGVDTYVLVSTDKAVRPTNVMGATKRVAELFVQSLAQSSQTRFVTTRFGNVLGSNGSVIPTFREQISQGGPVTVTDPEVTRFFMTIPEAAQLILQAGCMGRGGEIFLFDMGQPIKILSLAEEMIRLSGYRPYEDIDIRFTGLRPGEKLYEELLLDDEGTLSTYHEKICVAGSFVPAHDMIVEQIEHLVGLMKDLDYQGIRECLQDIVPEYQPQNSVKMADDLELHQADI